MYLWGVRDILHRCAKGDQLAQEEVYKSYFGYAFTVAMLYCNDRSNAMSIVNDSFMKLFRSGKSYHPSLPFKGWFRRIVINSSLDFLRKQDREFLHSRSTIEIENISDKESDSASLDYRETGTEEDILLLLSALPTLHRRVFILSQIEGYSHLEISKLLKIPENSSRVYLTRARKQLREFYLAQNGA